MPSSFADWLSLWLRICRKKKKTKVRTRRHLHSPLVCYLLSSKVCVLGLPRSRSLSPSTSPAAWRSGDVLLAPLGLSSPPHWLLTQHLAPLTSRVSHVSLWQLHDPAPQGHVELCGSSKGSRDLRKQTPIWMAELEETSTCTAGGGSVFLFGGDARGSSEFPKWHTIAATHCDPGGLTEPQGLPLSVWLHVN